MHNLICSDGIYQLSMVVLIVLMYSSNSDTNTNSLQFMFAINDDLYYFLTDISREGLREQWL